MPNSWGVTPGLYCHPCAAACGLLQNIYTSDLGRSVSQQAKTKKHLEVSSRYPTLTVFKSTGLVDYAYHIVRTQEAGIVQIDESGRRNIVWLAGLAIGDLFRKSTDPIKSVDGIALVLSSIPHEAHVFPRDMVSLIRAVCRECHREVLTPPKYLLPAPTYRV
jgi:hypothetical protein